MNQIFKDNITKKLYTMLHADLDKKSQLVFSDLVHKKADKKLTSFEDITSYLLDAKEVEEIYNTIKK